jgi:hypothetical protein
MFFIAINNLHGLQDSQNPSERNNMLSLASFVIKQAYHSNVLEEFYNEANSNQKQFIQQIAKSFVGIDLQ